MLSVVLFRFAPHSLAQLLAANMCHSTQISRHSTPCCTTMQLFGGLVDTDYIVDHEAFVFCLLVYFRRPPHWHRSTPVVRHCCGVPGRSVWRGPTTDRFQTGTWVQGVTMIDIDFPKFHFQTQTLNILQANRTASLHMNNGPPRGMYMEKFHIFDLFVWISLWTWLLS